MLAPNKSIPLSVALIQKNEERVLARCLESVSWAEEIIIVDSGSTDRSKAIALDPSAPWKKKVKWIDAEWRGFSGQRNLGLDHCKNQWVFFIDADEAMTPKLQEKIFRLFDQPIPESLDAFKVRRQEYFLGRAIHYGIWNPSFHPRLFRKDRCQYAGDVHEGLAPKHGKEIHWGTPIQESIDHDPNFNVVKFLIKLDRYTQIQAEQDVKNGLRTHFIRALLAGPAMFLKNLFYYRGILDGWIGILISILEGYSRVVRHFRVIKLKKRTQKS